jgi:hypothetical protein
MMMSMALAALVFVAVSTAAARQASALISCTYPYGCAEGKYARRPIAGMNCRNTTNKRPGHRYLFFCMRA